MSRRNPMPDSTDAPIKLFGRSIQLPDSNSPPPASAASDSVESGASSLAEPSDGCAGTRKKEVENGVVGESNKDGTSTDEFQRHEDMKNTDVKGKDQPVAESDSGSEEKVLKKPDKILPCPRCNSMETKFCYFNNYNVNQPRHFCKSCQRYWTAGGTIRNVPVGAGRRKNKQISSQFQPLVVSSNAGPLAHVNLLSPADPRCLSPTGLASPTFAMETKEVRLNGNDSSLCRSVAASLTLQDQNKAINNSATACIGRMTLPSSSGTSAPSAAMSTESVLLKEAVEMGQVGSSASHVAPLPNLQGYPGPPAYPWNMGWTGMAYSTTDSGQAVLVPWGLPPMAAVPRFCGPTPGVVPLVPSPYWTWDASAWNGPATSNLSPSSSAGNRSCSGNTSPLGKHSRDLNSKVEEATEKSLWVPKTLRIDDPDEAAKSSIWTTLGIKPGKGEPFSKSRPTKDFLRKSEGDAQKSGGNKMLQANPAALSRFHAFQEST